MVLIFKYRYVVEVRRHSTIYMIIFISFAKHALGAAYEACSNTNGSSDMV